MKAALNIFARTLLAYGALVAGLYCLWLIFARLSTMDPRAVGWAPKASEGHLAPLVVIDPGHGGHDRGATAHDLIEKHAALDIAKRLKSRLESAGIQVRMTREDDKFLALEERARIANDLQAAAFISLHLNTSTANDAPANGIETFFTCSKSLGTVKLIRAQSNIPSNVGIRDNRGRNLAEVIQRVVCSRTGAENRGVKERDYTVIHRTACPSVLVECGFMTDAAEAARLKRDEYRNRLAAGIADGIRAFLCAQSLKPDRGLELSPPQAQLAGTDLVAGP